MKYLTILILAYLLTACGGGGGGGSAPKEEPQQTPDYHVIGDSLCDPDYNKDETWPNILGLSSDCLRGRRTWGKPNAVGFDVPKGNIIIALGTNDAAEGASLEQFRETYQAIIGHVDGDLACVLPIFDTYDDIIRSLCSTVIDHAEPDHSDGIHYTGEAQQIQAELTSYQI